MIQEGDARMRSAQEKKVAILWCLQRAPQGLTVSELANLTGMWVCTVRSCLIELEITERRVYAHPPMAWLSTAHGAWRYYAKVLLV
jgi:hypothetical protein